MSIRFVSKVYCTPVLPPLFFPFHLNGRNFMSDNTHIGFGITPLQSYDVIFPSLNVMNAKLLCVKIQDCLPLFHIAEFHKIHTANSPSSFLRDVFRVNTFPDSVVAKKSYTNNKI